MILDILFQRSEVLEVLSDNHHGTVYKIKTPAPFKKEKVMRIINVPDESEKSDVQKLIESGKDEYVKRIYQYRIMDIREELYQVRNLNQNLILSNIDYEVIENEDGIGGKIYIIMNYYENLTDYINRIYGHASKMRVDYVIDMAEGVLDAIECCHNANIIHGNINPKNIFFLEHGKFILGDFADSENRLMKKTKYKGRKMAYLPPEIIRVGKKDKTVDLYEFGLVLYEILNDGRMPFLPRHPIPYSLLDYENAIQKRMACVPFPDIEGIGELNAVIKKACHWDPQKRYQSAIEMKNALSSIDKRRLLSEE